MSHPKSNMTHAQTTHKTHQKLYIAHDVQTPQIDVLYIVTISKLAPTNLAFFRIAMYKRVLYIVVDVQEDRLVEPI